jgi:pyruvyl transferase EpsO
VDGSLQGGNFGDLYRSHNVLLVSTVNEFPENPIIILPQTVYYKDEVLVEHDEIWQSFKF